MYQAILSKCITSEFLHSLQSSDELKMYAWIGIVSECIIITPFKGNSSNFKGAELLLRFICPGDLNTSGVDACLCTTTEAT